MLGHLRFRERRTSLPLLGRPSAPSRWRAPVSTVLAGVLLLALAPAASAGPAAGEPEVPERAYHAAGTAVTGGTSIAEAAEIGPGAFRDSLATGSEDPYTEGSVLYYRVAVEDGERVHASATIAAPPYGDGLPEETESVAATVGFVTADGQTCDDSSTDGVGEGAITATAVSGAVGPDGCSGDTLYLRVARTGPRLADLPLPVEVQVALQPAGLGGGAPVLEEPIDDNGATPAAPSSTDPVTPGRSFVDPLAVDPGSVVVELVPGETAVLALPVEEGQRLRWRTEVVSAPEDAGSFSLRVQDAIRGQASTGGGTQQIGAVGAVTGGGMAAPVDLGNRSSAVGPIASSWLPGEHTVVLHRLERSAADRAEQPAGDDPVRMILTLEVEGESAEDAVSGTGLEMGETGSGSSWGAGRIAVLVVAVGLALLGILSGIGGILVLVTRKR